MGACHAPHSPGAEEAKLQEGWEGHTDWKATPRSKRTHGKELSFQDQRENSFAATSTMSLPEPGSDSVSSDSPCFLYPPLAKSPDLVMLTSEVLRGPLSVPTRLSGVWTEIMGL